MSQVFRNLGKAATSTYPVLLCGENGTGKELLARAIHRASPRRRKNFIAVDCAMPFSAEQLAQWFEPPQPGVRGGNHRSTHGGTLFFNNLDDLPLDGQNRLLAHLPESGATEGCAADVRIIAATRTQLEARVAEGRFHADLYGRIHVLCQTLPPLRQRDNDILLLAQHFLRQERGPNSPLLGFTSQAVDAMIRHTWPGNARELLNRVRRAVVLSENRMISPADLDLACGAPISGQVMKLQEARLEAEKNAIRAAMRMCGNNLSLAAKALDISRMTLYRLLQRNAAEPIDLPETELRIRRPRKNLRLKSSTPIPLAYSGKDR
jgi:DNA-binding NtrC family response regulator